MSYAQRGAYTPQARGGGDGGEGSSPIMVVVIVMVIVILAVGGFAGGYFLSKSTNKVVLNPPKSVTFDTTSETVLWTYVPGADNYLIYLTVVGDTDVADDIFEPSKGANICDISNVIKDPGSYRVRVKAVRGKGEDRVTSDFSETISFDRNNSGGLEIV